MPVPGHTVVIRWSVITGLSLNTPTQPALPVKMIIIMIMIIVRNKSVLSKTTILML